MNSREVEPGTTAWKVFRLSRRMSHSSMPRAQNTLAARGTMTTVEPTSSAILQACIEQAPPALTRAYSRGSWPRCTETTFVASAMFWLMIRKTPAAASISVMPSGSAMTLLHGRARLLLVHLHLAAQEEVLVEVAQDEVGVGHRGLLAAQAVAHGPGSEPAEAGPTFSIPPASIQAIEPPPAPMVWMSNIGLAIR